MSHAPKKGSTTNNGNQAVMDRSLADGAKAPAVTERPQAPASPPEAPAAGGFRAKMLRQIKLARTRGVPLIGISTPDEAATAFSIRDHCSRDVDGREVPMVRWDSVRGMSHMNELGMQFLSEIMPDGGFDPTIGNCGEAMGALRKLAGKRDAPFVALVHMAHRWLHDPIVVQALALLRDELKARGATVFLLAPAIVMPLELAGDTMVFDEPLPDRRELDPVIDDQVRAAELSGSLIGDVDREKALEALQGLSTFQAEQVVAMSLHHAGVDLESLWERKRRQIEQTPGLSVFRGGENFDGIGGCEAIKNFARRVLEGRDRPNCVVFVDEIEKMLGGSGTSGGDTSGVSQDQLGQLLSYMQDHGATGMLFVGPPGTAKSMVAKAAGNHAGVPTIRLDLGGAKGSLVGQSEQNIRAALKVITSISGGRSLWIATSNSITDLPPELRRRFTLGTWFFDLPTAEERADIWQLYTHRYGGAHYNGPGGDQDVQDNDWTGAEIRQCCELAWRIQCPLVEAARYVVPVAKSAPDQLARLRNAAAGRFLSAQRPGVYSQLQEQADVGRAPRRRLAIGSAS